MDGARKSDRRARHPAVAPSLERVWVCGPSGRLRRRALASKRHPLLTLGVAAGFAFACNREVVSSATASSSASSSSAAGGASTGMSSGATSSTGGAFSGWCCARGAADCGCSIYSDGTPLPCGVPKSGYQAVAACPAMTWNCCVSSSICAMPFQASCDCFNTTPGGSSCAEIAMSKNLPGKPAFVVQTCPPPGGDACSMAGTK